MPDKGPMPWEHTKSLPTLGLIVPPLIVMVIDHSNSASSFNHINV